MDKLREMIQPTVGILTNIGPAHSDGFRSTEDKMVEQLKLFKEADRLIYSPKYIPSLLISEGTQLFTWGFEETDLTVLRKEKDKGFMTIYAEIVNASRRERRSKYAEN